MKSDILFIQFLKKGKVSRMLALSRKKEEAGVEEIYIVVGYMKEKFFY